MVQRMPAMMAFQSKDPLGPRPVIHLQSFTEPARTRRRRRLSFLHRRTPPFPTSLSVGITLYEFEGASAAAELCGTTAADGDPGTASFVDPNIQVHHHRRRRCGEVVPDAAVHGAESSIPPLVASLVRAWSTSTASPPSSRSGTRLAKNYTDLSVYSTEELGARGHIGL
ncbi:hypothetical protein BS78_01G472800 [Paspalum vaginatum]|nr:hypothetical protein BS78_01G472800 [Paspalum vaginatum]